MNYPQKQFAQNNDVCSNYCNYLIVKKNKATRKDGFDNSWKSAILLNCDGAFAGCFNNPFDAGGLC